MLVVRRRHDELAGEDAVAVLDDLHVRQRNAGRPVAVVVGITDDNQQSRIRGERERTVTVARCDLLALLRSDRTAHDASLGVRSKHDRLFPVFEIRRERLRPQVPVRQDPPRPVLSSADLSTPSELYVLIIGAMRVRTSSGVMSGRKSG
ncbi:hypothetical protein ACFQL4_08300 [Halosimplex aquaticum]